MLCLAVRDRALDMEFIRGLGLIRLLGLAYSDLSRLLALSGGVGLIRYFCRKSPTFFKK